MAAYSYHPHHFLFSSAFIPNTAPFDISSFPSNLLIPSTEFSPMEARRESFSDAVVYQNSCHDHSSKMHSVTSSIDMEKVEEKKSRKGSSLHSTQSKRRKVQGKTKKEKKVNIGENVEEKTPKAKASKKSVMECSEDALKDYIHVRARRGQATDSHSLAERVRRERISERMKMLQALVPGCETVTGKALMLDEIINYVQSPQNQIEFLSMKLASFNPIYSNFALDLDGAILKQDQRLIALAASQPSGSTSSQLCSPTTVNYNSSTNTITTPTTGFHPLIESSLLLQQFQEAVENLAWNQIDNQTQNFMNQSGLGNGMCSFQ